MQRHIVLVALLFLFCTTLNAHIVVNSLEYVDVVSAASYANVIGDTSYYIYPASSLQSAVLAVGAQEVTLVSSGSAPVHTGYKNALESNGATVVGEMVSSDPLSFNLELASSAATQTCSFVLTDPDYTYNSVSLFGYAKASASYILFATKDNALEVASFLSGAAAGCPSGALGEILVYGSVDSSVLSALSSEGILFEQIETGDKYSDNIELLKRYFGSYGSEGQMLFADGTFLEPSITEGAFPVMLVSHTIPEESEEYIASLVEDGSLEVGVLIKSDYTSPVYNLMKNINAQYPEDDKRFSVFVKMGQTSAIGGEMQALDFYPLPGVVLELALEDVQYNTAKEEVELILTNTGTVATYATSTIRVYSDGELVATVGDDEPVLLAKGETRGISYPLAIESPGALAANITVYYSSSKIAFENALTAYVDMGMVDFVDSSMLEITTATYSPAADTVSIKLTNPGQEDVYFMAEVSYTTDLSSSTLSAPEVKSLTPGQSTVVQFSGLLISEEELDSLQMSATARYGGREEFLVNEVSSDVEIVAAPEPEEVEQADMALPLLAVALAIIVAAIFLFGKKRKKEGPAAQKPAAPAPLAPAPKPRPKRSAPAKKPAAKKKK
ncbi:hypothetical protein JW721_05185 [Candidatus Micrarchaeota archaeon]|nr:hypothetical protein [Candidatus Micrarchaeota archaeon]